MKYILSTLSRQYNFLCELMIQYKKKIILKLLQYFKH